MGIIVRVAAGSRLHSVGNEAAAAGASSFWCRLRKTMQYSMYGSLLVPSGGDDAVVGGDATDVTGEHRKHVVFLAG